MFLSGLSEEFKSKAKNELDERWHQKGECREWPGPLNGGGYGTYKDHLVHRLSYALFVDDFKSHYFICHHCDNPKCYRPSHLYVGDHKSNGRDAAERKRTISRSIYKKATA